MTDTTNPFDIALDGYDDAPDLWAGTDYAPDPATAAAMMAAHPDHNPSVPNIPVVGTGPDGAVTSADLELARMTAEEARKERARRAARKQVDHEEAAAHERDEDIELDPSVADEPQFLTDGVEPLTEDEITAAQTSRPLFLSDFMGTRTMRQLPDLMEIDGDTRCIFYTGKYNTVIGEPSRGKSLLTQLLVATLAMAGRRSLVIDYEKDFEDFAERMRDFGVTQDSARNIAYWSPTKALRFLMPRILAFCAKFSIDTVIVDSVGGSISMLPGYSEDKNDHVLDWFNHDIKPMLRWKLTVISVDHFKKPREGEKVGRFASGAGGKLRVVTGTAVLMKNIEQFSLDKAGWSKVICGKSNKGGWAEGETMAEFHVTPGAEATLFEVKANSTPVGSDGKQIPTVNMERCSKFIEDYHAQHGVWPSENQAIGTNGVKGGTATLRVALDQLEKDGYLRREPGSHSAKLQVIIKPYRQANDPRIAAAKKRQAEDDNAADADPAAPSGSGGFGGSSGAFDPSRAFGGDMSGLL